MIVEEKILRDRNNPSLSYKHLYISSTLFKAKISRAISSIVSSGNALIYYLGSGTIRASKGGDSPTSPTA